MLVCSKCKGTQVQSLVWADANNGIYISDGPEGSENQWCAECEEHVTFEEVEDEDLKD